MRIFRILLILLFTGSSYSSLAYADSENRPEDGESRGWQTAGIATISGGLAFLATSLVYRSAAQDKKRHYDALVRDMVPWQEGQRQAFDDWQGSLNSKRLTMSFGALAVVSGSLLYYFSRSSDSNANSARVHVLPSASADNSEYRAGVDLGMRF